MVPGGNFSVRRALGSMAAREAESFWPSTRSISKVSPMLRKPPPSQQSSSALTRILMAISFGFQGKAGSGRNTLPAVGLHQARNAGVDRGFQPAESGAGVDIAAGDVVHGGAVD